MNENVPEDETNKNTRVDSIKYGGYNLWCFRKRDAYDVQLKNSVKEMNDGGFHHKG